MIEKSAVINSTALIIMINDLSNKKINKQEKDLKVVLHGGSQNINKMAEYSNMHK